MLLRADARELPLLDGSVDCCVTSPPYFRLRDYGYAEQIGLEETPESYIEALVLVFRQVWRALSDRGSLWLNLGDSYGAGKTLSDAAARGNWMRRANAASKLRSADARAKDLLLMPARVALALQADGWILRNDIVWSKPNPMPESISDRMTKAHEFVFFFVKSADYYFDAESIKEPASKDSHPRGRGINPKAGKNERSGDRRRAGFNQRFNVKQNASFAAAITGLVEMRNRRDVWTIATEQYKGNHFAPMPGRLVEPCILAGCPPAGKRCDCAELIATPIGRHRIEDPTLETGRAGYNRPRLEGQGTRKISRREQRDYAEQLRRSPHRGQMAEEAGRAFSHYIRTDRSGARPIPPALLEAWRSRGWLQEPAPCTHPIAPAGIVLDPFFGSGTVGEVAERLGRRWIGVDRSYQDLAKVRTAQRGLALAAGGER